MVYEASLEYLISDFSIFEKLNMIRRASDLHNKIVRTDELVFPKNPMLHMLDNIGHSQQTTDTFDVERYPFINNRKNIKYLHNFTQFDKVDPNYLAKFGHRIYRSKLFENLRVFNLGHRKVMIPIQNIDQVVGNKNAVIVENYNPLYRILSTNHRPISHYYRYQAIVSTILQNAISYDRQHFLIVPVENDFALKRSDITAISQLDEMSSQRLFSSRYFDFFMIDLAALLLNNDSKVSVFNSISHKDLSRLNVILIHNEECIIFNFGKLASLITSKSYVFNFLNLISRFSGSNDVEEDESTDEVIAPIVDPTETLSDVINIPISELSWYYHDKADMINIFKTLSRNRRDVTCYGIKSSSNRICASALIVKDFPGRIISEDYFSENEQIRLLTNVYTEPDYRRQKLMDKIIRKIISDNGDNPLFLKVDNNNKIAQDLYIRLGFKQTTLKSNDHDSLIFKYGKEEEVPVMAPLIPTTSVPKKKALLIPKLNLDKPVESSFLSKITDKVILKNVILSDKQQNRIETLADKYKTIAVQTSNGEKTLDEILSESIDINFKPNKLKLPNDDGISEDMLSSTTQAFDTAYREKLLHRDIIESVVCFRDNGLFLTSYVEKNEYNQFTRIKYIRAGFTDIRGKSHTLNFKIPMPDDEGYFLVNGVRLSMSKQFINIPICKISPTRVSLISDFNKTLVDKISSVRYSLESSLAKQADKLGITLIPSINSYIGIKLPYDYKLLGKVYSTIITPDYTFYFEYHNRFKFFNISDKRQDTVDELEDRYGTLIGKLNSDPNVLIFMSDKCSLTGVNLETLNQEMIPKHIVSCFNNFQVSPEWCDLKILDKNIPIGFILSYRYGISKVLSNLKIDYRFVEKGTRQRVIRKPTEISIEFADGWLVIDRYPLIHSYIISGFQSFPTLSNYQFIDLDGKDAYYGLITEKGLSMNYLKGIDNHFSFFIGPITRGVLEEMGEPTNTRDLLIRAVDMLVNGTDKEPSSVDNFRERSAEKIPAMIYNEISRQYANYINSEFRDISFSINTEAIFQRIIQDETMNLREDLNPIHTINKESSRVTHAGFGGRSAQAFVARDRKYAKDAVGIISEATTDSGSVGMVATLSGNPKIKNLRGMFDISKEDLTPTNILSDVSLLMPNATHDD